MFLLFFSLFPLILLLYTYFQFILKFYLISFFLFVIFSGVLKLYLRELPEPLLLKSLYDEWIAASK